MITFEQGIELLKAKAQKKAAQLRVILEENNEEEMLMFILGTSDLLRDLVFRHLDLSDQMRLLKITQSIHDTVTQKQ